MVFNRRLFIPAAAGGVLLIASTLSSLAGPNCHCRTQTGEKVQVGNFTCIKTNEGMKEALCDYVLNNTAWKLTGNACPVAWNQLKDRFIREKSNPKINVAVIDFKLSPLTQ